MTSREFAAKWWTDNLYNYSKDSQEKFEDLLLRELSKKDTNVLSTNTVPSGPLFNTLFSMGLNAHDEFNKLPKRLTMWVSENRVFLLDEGNDTNSILFADDWEHFGDG